MIQIVMKACSEEQGLKLMKEPIQGVEAEVTLTQVQHFLFRIGTN